MSITLPKASIKNLIQSVNIDGRSGGKIVTQISDEIYPLFDKEAQVFVKNLARITKESQKEYYPNLKTIHPNSVIQSIEYVSQWEDENIKRCNPEEVLSLSKPYDTLGRRCFLIPMAVSDRLVKSNFRNKRISKDSYKLLHIALEDYLRLLASRGVRTARAQNFKKLQRKHIRSPQRTISQANVMYGAVDSLFRRPKPRRRRPKKQRQEKKAHEKAQEAKVELKEADADRKEAKQEVTSAKKEEKEEKKKTTRMRQDLQKSKKNKTGSQVKKANKQLSNQTQIARSAKKDREQAERELKQQDRRVKAAADAKKKTADAARKIAEKHSRIHKEQMAKKKKTMPFKPKTLPKKRKIPRKLKTLPKKRKIPRKLKKRPKTPPRKPKTPKPKTPKPKTPKRKTPKRKTPSPKSPASGLADMSIEELMALQQTWRDQRTELMAAAADIARQIAEAEIF